MGELASVLVGLGSKVWVQVPLFAAVLFGMKDLFFVDGRELWENFCGRVSITTPSPDLITI